MEIIHDVRRKSIAGQHSPTTMRGTTSVVADIEGGEGYNCGHAMSVRVNVVIDVTACNTTGVTNAAAAIVEAIAGKFPT